MENDKSRWGCGILGNYVNSNEMNALKSLDRAAPDALSEALLLYYSCAVSICMRLFFWANLSF